MTIFQVTAEEYVLIGGDLRRAEHYLARLKEAEVDKEDRLVREALTMAAIVAYCRPFQVSKDAASGSRRWLSEVLVNDLPEECQRTHKRLQTGRDQAWAHTDWRAHQPRPASPSTLPGFPSLISRRDPWLPLRSEEIAVFEELLREVNARITISPVSP